MASTFELGLRGTFHAIDLGPRDAPPLLWLHGFPDHPPTALPLLELVTRSRRVIAPWLRGYAPSPLEGPYDVETLVGDVRALIDQLSPERPIDVIGHDWGAVISYGLCAIAPNRVRRAVALAVPHPLTFLRALRTSAQMRRSWYIALFQIPGSERLVRANSLAMVDHLWRTWSPEFVLDDHRRRALHACLAASLPGPIHYYRALVRPLAQFRARVRSLAAPLVPPILQLFGANDGCILPPSDPTHDARRFAHREVRVLAGVGHFLHLEDPVTVADAITSWVN